MAPHHRASLGSPSRRREAGLIGPMGVEQTTVVDAIGINQVSGAVHLTIADALEWDAAHLRVACSPGRLRNARRRTWAL